MNAVSADTAAPPPTALQRVEEMLAGIRADEARRRELANPHRPNRMLAAVMGGDAAKIAELRAVAGELAREVVALKAALAQAVEPWHVVSEVTHCRGISGPDFCVLKLRNGLALEIGDEGVLAYDPSQPPVSNTVGNILFTKPTGGA